MRAATSHRVFIYFDVGDGTRWLSASRVPFDYQSQVWYHVAVVATPTGATYYVDGSQVGYATYTGIPLLFDSTHKVEIGTR
jgi:concanavalin A-like lectin/glucanase superfamily protein